MDPDDWIEKGMFERLYSVAKEEDADIVWCNYFENSSIEEKLIKQEIIESPEALLDAVMREYFMGNLWNKLIKRNLFVRNNVRFLDGVNMAEDTNVLLKVLALSITVKYIPIAYYHYVISNSNSLTHNSNQIIRAESQYNHITSLIDAIDYLSSFYLERITKENMIIYKLLAKRLYLFSSNMNNFKLWSDIYPEVNPFVFRCIHTKLRYKLMGWISAHHWWFLIRIWVFIKKYKN